jgi:hypothetical protein
MGRGLAAAVGVGARAISAASAVGAVDVGAVAAVTSVAGAGAAGVGAAGAGPGAGAAGAGAAGAGAAGAATSVAASRAAAAVVTGAGIVGSCVTLGGVAVGSVVGSRIVLAASRVKPDRNAVASVVAGTRDSRRRVGDLRDGEELATAGAGASCVVSQGSGFVTGGTSVNARSPVARCPYMTRSVRFILACRSPNSAPIAIAATHGNSVTISRFAVRRCSAKRPGRTRCVAVSTRVVGGAASVDPRGAGRDPLSSLMNSCSIASSSSSGGGHVNSFESDLRSLSIHQRWNV